MYILYSESEDEDKPMNGHQSTTRVGHQSTNYIYRGEGEGDGEREGAREGEGEGERG